MALIQGRRRFVSNAAVAGAAGFGVLGAIGRGDGGRLLAAEAPPEITTIRIDSGPFVCLSPQFVAEELLHAEGFAEIHYDEVDTGGSPTEKLASGEVDWILEFAPGVIADSENGAPVTMVAGMHIGCFELFAQGDIRNVSDLKGRRVGVAPAHETPRHLVSLMASYVGLNPNKDIQWAIDPSAKLMNLFVDRKIDAFLGSPAGLFQTAR